MREFIMSICSHLSLGTLTAAPERAYGGYMHKMYFVSTDRGRYAVKILNPTIMQRPDVFDNYKRADTLERKLECGGLPIVPSLEFNGSRMQCLDGRYFYVFERIDGRALKSEEIQPLHCEIIGGLLAEIHGLEVLQAKPDRTRLSVDWDGYVSAAEKNCPEILEQLKGSCGLLYDFQLRSEKAVDSLPDTVCICNGDMDSKNVLWTGCAPHIIDLESLDYGSPYTELFELALCWSGYEHCSLDYGLLRTFFGAYIKKAGSIPVSPETLFYSSTGRLEWLEYNLKRAVTSDNADCEEKSAGIQQVKETLDHTAYYHSIRDPLLSALTELLR